MTHDLRSSRVAGHADRELAELAERDYVTYATASAVGTVGFYVSPAEDPVIRAS